MKPLVTIILPVYNSERYIKESISSILMQTFTNFELLLLDDGSIDRTLEIMSSIKDKRIKLVTSKRNKGLIYQLNLGLKIAKGNYIARMDADDISYPNRIEKQVHFLESNRYIGVCGTYARVVTEEKEFIKDWQMPNWHKNIKVELLEGAVLCHPSVMFRAEVIKKNLIKYSDKWDYLEDYELWTRLIHKTQFHVLPEVLLNYRQHKKQISEEKKILQRRLMDKLIEKQILNIGRLSKERIDNILFFLTSRWHKLEIFNLIKDWNDFVYLAQKKSYEIKALNKLFYKRLFYFVADIERIPIHMKFYFLMNLSGIYKYWSFKKILILLRK